MMRTVHLREHATTTIRLSPEELDDLSRCGARLEFRPRGDGAYDVRASEMVGAVSMPRLRLVIEPKVSVERLFALLCFSTTPLNFRSHVPSEVHDDLLLVMQNLFAEALEQALRSGLIRGYEPRRERLHSLRGRLDVKALALRRFGVLPPMDCEFDEYTTDIEVNRRLLAAALLLVRDRGPSSGRLLSLAARMHDVSEVVYSRTSIEPLTLDRRFAHVRAAASLADLVLRHASVELVDGVATSLGFLVDMDRLFEDVVVEGLRGLFPPHVRWIRQPKGLSLDEHGHITIRPDAVAWSRGPRLVVDVKYKATADAKSSDLYQLVAYAHALQAPHGALVYATGVRDRHLRVRGGGPDVEVLHLDLDCDQEELQRRLLDLADKLRACAGL